MPIVDLAHDPSSTPILDLIIFFVKSHSEDFLLLILWKLLNAWDGIYKMDNIKQIVA
jgi:hypothetical protein